MEDGESAHRGILLWSSMQRATLSLSGLTINTVTGLFQALCGLLAHCIATRTIALGELARVASDSEVRIVARWLSFMRSTATAPPHGHLLASSHTLC